MGLRCVIGHDYGATQTSHDRHQRGSEVVVTVREFRECERCGHRRIVSENKEVTVDRDAAADDGLDDATAPTTGEHDDAGWAATASAGASPSTSSTEQLTAEEDDGIILEDDPVGPTRGYGEWPDAEVGPSPPDEPVGYDAWPDEDADVDADAPSPPADGAATGDEAAAGPDDDGILEATAGGDVVSGGPTSSPTRADATASSRRRPLRPDPRDTEFVCPDCGETWPTHNASLRPGDICPACRRGYLEERVLQ